MSEAEQERARVVAWLKGYRRRMAGGHFSVALRLYLAWIALRKPHCLPVAAVVMAADAIASGDHLKGVE